MRTCEGNAGLHDADIHPAAITICQLSTCMSLHGLTANQQSVTPPLREHTALTHATCAALRNAYLTGVVTGAVNCSPGMPLFPEMTRATSSDVGTVKLLPMPLVHV